MQKNLHLVEDMLRIPAIDAVAVWVNQFAALTTNSKEKEPMMGEEYMCVHVYVLHYTSNGKRAFNVRPSTGGRVSLISCLNTRIWGVKHCWTHPVRKCLL